MNTKTKQEIGDPIGQAILDYAQFKKPFDIIVSSDLCDDDIIPIEVLFRKEEEMPELELTALDLCRGHVLDIGAGAGVHALALQDRGHKVSAIDVSEGAVTYMSQNGISAQKIDFYKLSDQTQYDTILSLMNGVGLAKHLANLPEFLKKIHDKKYLICWKYHLFIPQIYYGLLICIFLWSNAVNAFAVALASSVGEEDLLWSGIAPPWAAGALGLSVMRMR